MSRRKNDVKLSMILIIIIIYMLNTQIEITSLDI
jgi:hypothetical protein